MTGKYVRECPNCRQSYLDHKYFPMYTCLILLLFPLFLLFTVIWFTIMYVGPCRYLDCHWQFQLSICICLCHPSMQDFSDRPCTDTITVLMFRDFQSFMYLLALIGTAFNKRIVLVFSFANCLSTKFNMVLVPAGLSSSLAHARSGQTRGGASVALGGRCCAAPSLWPSSFLRYVHQPCAFVLVLWSFCNIPASPLSQRISMYLLSVALAGDTR